MEKTNKPNKPENVPYIVFEAEMARQERHIKRLWIAVISAILACVLIVVGFLLYLNQYDFVSYDYAQDGKGGYPREMGSYRGGSYRGGSYARGRGSNARRDSMGRYSREGGMMDELHELMESAPNDTVRRDIQKLIDKMGQM